MHTTVSYNGRNYGNSEPATKYEVRIERSCLPGEILVTIKYDRPATGYGIGFTVGAVTSVSLRIPDATAITLARALLLAAELREVEPLRFHIDEGKSGADEREAA